MVWNNPFGNNEDTLGFGAGWVMWLMIGLSVISVAVMLERAWFFITLRDDLNLLARDPYRACRTTRQALVVSFVATSAAVPTRAAPSTAAR